MSPPSERAILRDFHRDLARAKERKTGKEDICELVMLTHLFLGHPGSEEEFMVFEDERGERLLHLKRDWRRIRKYDKIYARRYGNKTYEEWLEVCRP